MRATWLYLVGLMVSLVIFAMAIFISIRPVAREPWPPAAAAGKRVWQARGCVECHTLLGNGGYAAGDLTRVTTTTSRQELLTFLTQPPVMRPSRRQLHPALTMEEAERLLDFLEQVARINTGSWPPPPLRPAAPTGGKGTP
ncbi:c-type cytochrome [Moorella sp. Hama-1]|uniref:c-type cytochrome n=1 Tax=Moorella sp. Hama-1 TaxID=2138101 RepID=UPI000D64A4E3|nr:c-type cytochrome [Moorella sp. Hama-1]BCV21091.1 cytochrome c [Moorella sp. Hama-1]